MEGYGPIHHPLMTYQWQFIAGSSDAELRVVQWLAEQLRISIPAATLLVNRNLTTPDVARAFIRPSLSQQHDPFLMNDMAVAVERLHEAVTSHEVVMIYGDYDVDGTTAVALVYRFLTISSTIPSEKLYYYIPDRYVEGYGLSRQGVDDAHAHHCTLMIVLDCGITDGATVDYANSLGIDVIICDHHLPPMELPHAVAVLDAHRADNTYPFQELSGCGTGYKLCYAYALKYHIDLHVFDDLYELLALSVAADIVPLMDENRVFAYVGLQQLNSHPCVGLKALIESASLQERTIDIHDIGFRLGPRLNACGRIQSGRQSVQLLLTSDPAEATQLGTTVNGYNTERQKLTDDIFASAVEQIASDFPEAVSTVVCGSHWHRGVLGIVASRLTEAYFRPTIVLTDEGTDTLSGSARSVNDFNLFAALVDCKDLLERFGGHHFAAGLSVKKTNLARFRERFERYCSEHLTESQKTPILSVDCELNLSDISDGLLRVIRALEPFGPGNNEPLFVTRKLYNARDSRAVGKNGEHLHLELTDGVTAISGIGFGLGKYADLLRSDAKVDICYALVENEFNGRRSIQVVVKDLKPIKN